MFVLEVKSWSEYEVENTFEVYADALCFGRDNFSQNEWRVRNNDDIVFISDLTHHLENIASQEINRFSNTEHWASVYRQRRSMPSFDYDQLNGNFDRPQDYERGVNHEWVKIKKTKFVLKKPNWMLEGF